MLLNGKSILSAMEDIIEEMRGDWKGLFLSPEFHLYLQKYGEMLLSGVFESLRVEGVDISKGVEENILKQMRIELIYDPNSEISTAATTMTDKKFVILLNGVGALVQQVHETREKFEVIMGLLVHEISHRIYTDFPCGIASRYAMEQKGQFFPLPPKNINSQEGLMFRSRLAANHEYRRTFSMVYNQLQNFTEDGYIENENRLHYPGDPSYYVDCMNDVMYDGSHSLEDSYNAEKETSNLELVMEQWLMYSVFGKFKLGQASTSLLSPEAENILYEGIEIIDEIVVERDPRFRCQKAGELLVVLSPLIDEEIEKAEQEQGQNQGQQGQAPSGGSAQANQAVQNAIQNMLNQLTNGIAQPNDSGCQTSSVSNPGKPQNSNMDKDALRNAGNLANQRGGGGKGASGEHDGSVSDKSLDEILNDLAANRVQEELENERKEALQREANELCGDKGSVQVYRSSSVDEERKTIYNELYAQVSAVSKRLSRLTKKRFKQEAEDDDVSRLMSGNKMSMKDYLRDPMKGFIRRVNNETKTNLEVFVLVDESGSMSGGRDSAAMITSILMEDFCRELQVPLTIYGYTTGYNDCELYSYVEPSKIDSSDKYRLTGISARGGTPTVQALQFAIGRLSKSDPKASKLVFVITDGQAGDDDAQGTETKVLLERAKRIRAQVIACGIGRDSFSIANQFGEENYIPIDNLEEMPERLLQIVQRGLLATRAA